MNVEVEKSKQDFIAAYNTVEKSTAEKLVQQDLQIFRETFSNADHYLDSIKTEMDKLDEMDVHNMELVKSTFLYKGVGDTIVSKMKASVAAAQSVARTEAQRAAIKNASDSLGIAPNTDRWKEQTFGMANTLGASMILYGLRTELYKIGMEALRNQ